MNFKKLTALILALLFSVNETASNVFAMDGSPTRPLLASSDFDQDPISSQENSDISLLKASLDSKDEIVQRNQAEIKDRPEEERQEIDTKDKNDTENQAKVKNNNPAGKTQEVDTKDVIDAENQTEEKNNTDVKTQEVEAKNIYTKILNCEECKGIDKTQYFDKETVLGKVVKLLVNKEKAALKTKSFSKKELDKKEEAYRTEVPKEYKIIMDEFLNTDFYTVENEKSNFQSEFGNINNKISQINKSVHYIMYDFKMCKNKINDSQNFNQTDYKKLGMNVHNYCEGAIGVKNIETLLNKINKDLDELQKKTENLKRDKDNTYDDLHNKYSVKGKEIYTDIATIIKIQGKKYDLQAEESLFHISRTKQLVLGLISNHVSPAVKETTTFLKNNPMVGFSYNEISKLEKKNENLQRQLLEYQNRYDPSAYNQSILSENELETTPRKNSEEKYKNIKTPIIPRKSSEEKYESIKTPTPPRENLKERNNLAKGDDITPPSVSICCLNRSPILKTIDCPDVENEKLINKKISEIFPDQEFAKFVDEYIFCKKDKQKFDPNYKLKKFDVYLIEHIDALDLNLHKNRTENLAGIEYFINLSALFCSKRVLYNINLSKNTKLEILDLSESTIPNSFLDLSENLNLKSLNCRKCKIKEIRLPKAKNIERIDLSSNSLFGKLDLSLFKNLQMVNLTSNNLTGLAIANENIITELNISKNENFGDFDFNKLSNLTSLDCSGTNRKSLLINNLKNLENLSFAFNEDIRKVDISSCTKLKELNCIGCSISEIDLLPLTSLEIVKCSYNNIKSLSIASNKIQQVNYDNNPLETIYLLEEAINNGVDLEDKSTGKDQSGRAEVKYLHL